MPREQKFEDIPDILDPDISKKLKEIARREFGDQFWNIQLYIADDGTGQIVMNSTGDEYGRKYSQAEIRDAVSEYTDKDEAPESPSWSKCVRWEWDDRYPSYEVTVEDRFKDIPKLPMEQGVLLRHDMQEMMDRMIFSAAKDTNMTAKKKNAEGETGTSYKWENTRRFGDYDTTMQNLREEDEEITDTGFDEFSSQFSEVYNIWMQSLRTRFNEAGTKDHIPEPFDCIGKDRGRLIDMINKFDENLVYLKEHRAADSANIGNYENKFSELAESYRYMKRNLSPQSTYSRDDFQEMWNRFTSKMDVLLDLLSEHSNLV